MADPQLLQLAQVDGFDGEHVHLHRRQEANGCVSKKEGKKWPRVIIFFAIKTYLFVSSLCTLCVGVRK